MNLVFKKMHIDNFMSFDKEVFDFQESNGICLITGVNKDVPGSKNGCGKCVDKDTLIDISFDDPNVRKKFEEFI